MFFLPDLRSLPAEAERILLLEFFRTVTNFGILSSRRINRGFGIAVGLRTGILGPELNNKKIEIEVIGM